MRLQADLEERSFVFLRKAVSLTSGSTSHFLNDLLGLCNCLELLSTGLRFCLEVLGLGHAIVVGVCELLDVLVQSLSDDCQISLSDTFGLGSCSFLLLSLGKLLVSKFDSIVKLQLESVIIELVIGLLFAGFLQLCLGIGKQIIEGVDNASTF